MGHLGRILAVLVFILSFVAWGETFTGKVVGLSEGDALSILIGESDIRTVHLSGVDCPDKGQEFSEEAKRSASSLCLGKQVSIQVTGTDVDGKLLGDVSLENGLSLNQELLKQGLAWHSTRYGADPALAALEARARQSRIGLWGEAHPVAPWIFRKEEPTPQSAASPGKATRTAKARPAQWMYAAPSEDFPESARNGANMLLYQPTRRQRQAQAELQASAIRSQYGMGPVANQLRTEIELNKEAEAAAYLFGGYDPSSQSYNPARDWVTMDRRTGVFHDMNSPWARMLYDEDKVELPRKEAIRRGGYPSSWDYNYWGW